MSKYAEYCKCVYVHRKKSDDSIFYVGIGNKNRPKSKYRSQLWNRYVDKYGYTVEILATGLTMELAKKLEIDLISYYGRVDIGTGCLVNHTDGGEGQTGRLVSQKTIDKIKQTKSNNNSVFSHEVVDKATGIKYRSVLMACQALGFKEGTVYSQINGTRSRKKWNTIYYTDESKNTGKVCKRFKKVLDTNTNKTYNTIKSASESLRINVSTLSQHLSGCRVSNKLKHLMYG